MSFIYGALTAGILWGGYLWLKNFKNSFSGQSSRLFCIFSSILFGLLAVFLIYVSIIDIKEGEQDTGIIIFPAIIFLTISIFSGINTKKQKK